jgi:hypothetical protein
MRIDGRSGGTGLIEKKTLDEAIALVRGKAFEMLGDRDLGVWMEVGNRSVMIGIARAGVGACVVQVSREEYDGLAFMDIITKDADGQRNPGQG